MGRFKDEHGKTRVGKFLQKVGGPVLGEVLNVAGDLTGIDALKKVGDVINKSKKITPEDKEMAMELLKLDIKAEEEVSKRWYSDMTSDSWMSKNIRPMVLAWLILLMTAIVISDSIENWTFDVKPAYITLIQTLLVTCIVAYFGSRGMEKYNKIKNGK